MIDRSKVKKMYVWDNREELKQARYVVMRNPDGSCYAISEFDEDKWKKKIKR